VNHFSFLPQRVSLLFFDPGFWLEPGLNGQD
jgi:hypothetical protein